MYDEQKARSEGILRARRRDKAWNGFVCVAGFFLFNGVFCFLAWFMGLFDALGSSEWSFATHLRMWVISVLYVAALFGFAKLVMKLGLLRDTGETEGWEQ
ncbi:MAG: hypothetical protein A4E65_00245 [Syntrophorhabdus sp. PtaU1.Bin153]|nr:MAG: hypothetical protein A4E65_00245 [Syntrophorhabdus sp. PtaU1.Bin153]